MNRSVGTVRRMFDDQHGQAALEWILIVAGFALPMILVFRLLMAVLGEYYVLVTFMETLPLP